MSIPHPHPYTSNAFISSIHSLHLTTVHYIPGVVNIYMSGFQKYVSCRNVKALVDINLVTKCDDFNIPGVK